MCTEDQDPFEADVTFVDVEMDVCDSGMLSALCSLLELH